MNLPYDMPFCDRGKTFHRNISRRNYSIMSDFRQHLEANAIWVGHGDEEY